MLVKVAEYSKHSDAIWRAPTSTKVTARIFTLALIGSVIVRFEIFELENLVKVTESNIRNDAVRWQTSVPVNFTNGIFALAINVSDISTFQIFNGEI